jgi:hypothetical protein
MQLHNSSVATAGCATMQCLLCRTQQVALTSCLLLTVLEQVGCIDAEHLAHALAVMHMLLLSSAAAVVCTCMPEP